MEECAILWDVLQLPVKIVLTNRWEIVNMNKLRLGVTGLSGAGKTIFLMSMINFLLESGSRHSDLFKKRKLRLSAKKIPVDPDSGLFPYEEYLENFKLGSPKWPEHTTKLNEFHLVFRLTREGRKKSKEFKLELADYPGEQLLDLPLLGKTYEQWSDETVAYMSKGAKLKISQQFRQACDKLPKCSGTEFSARKLIIDEYMTYLRQCKAKGLTYLQPSMMILENSDEKNFYNTAFCPLPKNIRLRTQDFTKKLKKQYAQYKSKHVYDFAKQIQKCSRQIVLVDVLQILKNGIDSYNDAKYCLNTILDTYKYRKNYGWLLNLVLKRFPIKIGIDRVSFVATKADQATRANRHNMKALLEDLVDKKHDYLLTTAAPARFHFAASNRCTEDKRKLYEGREISVLLGRHSQNEADREKLYYPGEVPSMWPEQWNPQKAAYRFPNFLPKSIPLRDGASFDRINLDEILLHIFGDLVE